MKKKKEICFGFLLNKINLYPYGVTSTVFPWFQQKHPHVIFEARTKANKGCANSGNLEWRQSRRQKHISGLTGKRDLTDGSRSRRDVREATKYIETALIIDKAMFEKRNGSTRAEVVHDAIQVANIADLVCWIFFFIFSHVFIFVFLFIPFLINFWFIFKQ